MVCAHKAWSFDHVPQERKKSAKEQAHGHAYARAHELASMRAHAHVRKKTLQGHLKVLRSSLWLRMENFTKSCGDRLTQVNVGMSTHAQSTHTHTLTLSLSLPLSLSPPNPPPLSLSPTPPPLARALCHMQSTLCDLFLQLRGGGPRHFFSLALLRSFHILLPLRAHKWREEGTVGGRRGEKWGGR